MICGPIRLTRMFGLGLAAACNGLQEVYTELRAFIHHRIGLDLVSDVACYSIIQTIVLLCLAGI